MLSGTDWIPTEWREVKLKIINGMLHLLIKCDLSNQVVFQKEWYRNNRQVADYTWANYIHKDFSAPKYIYTISSIKKPVSTPKQVIPKESKKFVLNLMDISELLGNTEFKTNITLGKVLKIIEDLIDDKEASKNLSKNIKLINYL